MEQEIINWQGASGFNYRFSNPDDFIKNGLSLLEKKFLYLKTTKADFDRIFDYTEEEYKNKLSNFLERWLVILKTEISDNKYFSLYYDADYSDPKSKSKYTKEHYHFYFLTRFYYFMTESNLQFRVPIGVSSNMFGGYSIHPGNSRTICMYFQQPDWKIPILISEHSAEHYIRELIKTSEVLYNLADPKQQTDAINALNILNWEGRISLIVTPYAYQLCEDHATSAELSTTPFHIEFDYNTIKINDKIIFKIRSDGYPELFYYGDVARDQPISTLVGNKSVYYKNI